MTVALRDEPAPLPILFRDDQLAVIDKPSGLAVHRGWAAEHDVAVNRLHRQLGVYVHPLHRLDRGASGALAFAFDPGSARAVGDDFAAGRIAKRYVALVRGIPPERFEVDYPLPRGEDRHGPRVDAVTSFERLEVIGRYSVVAAEPRTGRLHQIRRHLKHISCPILGDVTYGKGEHNRMCRERYGLGRLFLHATSLGLRHPISGDQLVITAPLACELEAALAAMRADPPLGPP
jgi:tRNA pseudouridine65 synthase